MASCKVVRTMLIVHSFMEFGSGKMTSDPLKEEWVTKPCDTPIFDKGKECSGCRRGWNHPNNYRADGPRPEKEVNP